jgi:hypothetical protein
VSFDVARSLARGAEEAAAAIQRVGVPRPMRAGPGERRRAAPLRASISSPSGAFGAAASAGPLTKYSFDATRVVPEDARSRRIHFGAAKVALAFSAPERGTRKAMNNVARNDN